MIYLIYVFSYQLSESSDENFPDGEENAQPNHLHPHIKDWADQDYEN